MLLVNVGLNKSLPSINDITYLHQTVLAGRVHHLYLQRCGTGPQCIDLHMGMEYCGFLHTGMEYCGFLHMRMEYCGFLHMGMEYCGFLHMGMEYCGFLHMGVSTHGCEMECCGSTR